MTRHPDPAGRTAAGDAGCITSHPAQRHRALAEPVACRGVFRIRSHRLPPRPSVHRFRGPHAEAAGWGGKPYTFAVCGAPCWPGPGAPRWPPTPHDRADQMCAACWPNTGTQSPE